MLITCLLIFCAGCSAQKTATVNVKDFGAKGDGVSDDYSAVLAAVDEVNRIGSGTLVFPKGTYFLKPYHTSGSSVRNIELKNVRGVEIIGNNSVIKVNGKHHRGADYSTGGYSYSNTGAVIPMLISSSSDVTVRNLEIDGGVASTTRDANLAEFGGHLILITNSENVHLQNLKVHHAQTDGIYIDGKSRNVTADQVESYNNARQGMSIIELHNGKFTNCTFRDTGRTGKYGGHSPQAGVDIEPHGAPNSVFDITFENCTFENNIGSQFVVSHPGTTANVFLKNCVFREIDGFHYAVIVNAKDVVFDSCIFDFRQGSLYPLWQQNGTSAVIRNSHITSETNGIVAVTGSDTNAVQLLNNTVEYVGKQPLEHYFPYIQMTNIIIENNRFIIPKRFGRVNTPTSLLQKAKRVKNNRFTDEKGAKNDIWVSYDLSNVVE